MVDIPLGLLVTPIGCDMKAEVEYEIEMIPLLDTAPLAMELAVPVAWLVVLSGAIVAT